MYLGGLGDTPINLRMVTISHSTSLSQGDLNRPTMALEHIIAEVCAIFDTNTPHPLYYR